MIINSLITKIRGDGDINLKCLAVGVFSVLFVWLAKHFQGNIYVQQIFDRIDHLGFWTSVLFVVLYIFMSGIFIPSVVFRVFAGTIFGVFQGVLLVSIGATISSFIKFLMARYLFQDAINRKIQNNESLKKLDEMIEKDGWKMLLLLRNIPVANAMFLNYICGVTKMSSKDFILASFIGRLPTTFLYVYLGYLVGYTSGIDGANQTRVTFEWVMLWAGLLASVGLTYYVIYISKRMVTEDLSDTVLSIQTKQ
ncbi:MAG: TVP38/TMEM64 family protein [Candidatus Omnitrophota bacterium]